MVYLFGYGLKISFKIVVNAKLQINI